MVIDSGVVPSLIPLLSHKEVKVSELKISIVFHDFMKNVFSFVFFAKLKFYNEMYV